MSATANSMPIDWRRRRRAARFDHGEPLLRASSLPFAILFSALGLVILSLWSPLQHAVLIDLPVTSGLGLPFEPWPEDLPRHVLRLTEVDRLWWDGNPINQSMLVQRLRESAMLQEGVIFKPEGDAAYRAVAHTLNHLKASGIADYGHLCLAGMADHRQFYSEDSPRLKLKLVMPAERQPPFPQPIGTADCDPGSPGPRHTHISFNPSPPPA